MRTGGIRLSRIWQGVKGSWKSDLKLKAQRGGESRPENGGEKERTSSNRKMSFREETSS